MIRQVRVKKGSLKVSEKVMQINEIVDRMISSWTHSNYYLI